LYIRLFKRFQKGGRRARQKRVCKNKQTYLLCFLKKEEEGGRDRRKREPRRETLAPPFTRIFKTNPIEYPCDLQDP
jgi:hypothetical protein